MKSLYLPASAILLIVAIFWTGGYGYYVFLRWAVCAMMIFAAMEQHEENSGEISLGVIAGGVLAFLFNPIFPVYLTRDIWAVIDAGGALALIIWWANSLRKKKPA